MNILSAGYHRARGICGKLELIPSLWITLLFPHQAKVSTMTILNNNNTETLKPALPGANQRLEGVNDDEPQ